MPFSLTIPTHLASRWTSQSATRITATDAAIQLGAMLPLPDDLERWMSAALRAGAAPGSEVHQGGVAEQATTKRWPLRLVGARVLDGDRLIEVRIGAFYRFFEYGAVALACAAPGETVDDVMREAVEILSTAEPDFSSEVVAVHQLWEGIESWRTTR
jgi:hypothetical protein